MIFSFRKRKLDLGKKNRRSKNNDDQNTPKKPRTETRGKGEEQVTPLEVTNDILLNLPIVENLHSTPKSANVRCSKQTFEHTGAFPIPSRSALWDSDKTFDAQNTDNLCDQQESSTN